LNAYLLHLMAIKRSNLCVSADVTTTSELLTIAEELGDSICLLKTHADIVSDWSDRTVRQLKEIAARKHFIIFEDRKFADIGSMSSPLSPLPPLSHHLEARPSSNSMQPIYRHSPEAIYSRSSEHRKMG
jgi:uridine monophosphate synthetase